MSPFDKAMADAQASRKPLVLLIVEPSRGDADRNALTNFDAALQGRPEVVRIELNLDVSRDRALSMPYHGLAAPTLVCLSSAGMVLSRVEGIGNSGTMSQQVNQALRVSADVDATFQQLSGEATEVRGRMALADFLIARRNAREAIPVLKKVADDEKADLATRVHAWVEMGRAHLWIGEPEKARYTSIDLADTLGPQTPDAIAGGNLIRGIQDTNAKRFGRAGEEFELAVSSAPASPYAKEAAGLLSKLPTTEPTK